MDAFLHINIKFEDFQIFINLNNILQYYGLIFQGFKTSESFKN